ncbi:MAG TPA: lipopolysaccharide transport periplasmic protein LptA [Gammaproteobacteria bacterium]|nr:lipopolysaccharide transport periplasmic protein LptA [Gammaproteobacteria bacterium]
MFLSLKLINGFCLAALLLPVASLGKSGDAEQSVHVEADAAQLNQATGVGVYRGQVRITQGSMVLTADKVTLIAPRRKLQKVIAQSDDKGDKSTFRQLTDAGDVLTAESRHIDYELNKTRVILFGDAILRRPPDRFAAERIVYRIESEVIDAGGRQSGGRVNMTLVPEDRGERPAENE